MHSNKMHSNNIMYQKNKPANYYVQRYNKYDKNNFKDYRMQMSRFQKPHKNYNPVFGLNKNTVILNKAEEKKLEQQRLKQENKRLEQRANNNRKKALDIFQQYI